MTVYQLDRFECVHSIVPEDQIDEDPMVPGRRLIPGGCIETDKPLPVLAPRQAAKWNGADFIVVPDFRGVPYWETVTHARRVIDTPEVLPPAGAHLADPGPSASDKLRGVQMDARWALAASDITVLRCFEHGAPVPATWVSYRAQLRQLLGVAEWDDSLVLPPQPEYPAGT